ncbi:MFS transporter [bacterium]|nr:MFS transporter [bacterium]
MEQADYKLYGYRWVVLSIFMLTAAVNQLLWITFAPITSLAAKFYGVSDLSIGFLSMSFMIVYVVVSIPASWVIDTYGIRIAVGFGAVLMAVFSIMRGAAGTNYNIVLIAQLGIAVGQPFILNSVTKVAANWFPLKERATASGLGTLSLYIGIILGLALTPYLTLHSSINSMLMIYGIASLIITVLFFILIKEKPPTPPCSAEHEERSLVFDGLKQILRKKNFLMLMFIFFVGLGVFNGVTTWIENILSPRGFSITQAGNAGGVMIGGGIIGALIIPMLSDKLRKRTPFIFIAIAGATIGLIGITYAGTYALLLLSAFIFGFFLLSAGPVGFQYAAEIAYPAPEGTSNGMVFLMGQISGIIFIFGMDSFKSKLNGSMTLPLVILIGLMTLSLILCIQLKESRLIRENTN